MEPAVILVLALAVAALGAVLSWVLFSGRDAPDRRSRQVVPVVPQDSTSASAQQQLDVAPVSAGYRYELRLAGQALMTLQQATEIEVADRQPISGAYARFLGSLLEQDRVVEFLGRDRYVLARVPKAIREGGQWMRTADGQMKAIAVDADTKHFAAIAEIVKGGVQLGTAAALGPAILAAASTAQSQHRIEEAIADLGRTLDEMSERVRDADLGVVLGAQELLSEVAEWGPPHRWPEQLRWELAVRRAAIDPVWYSLQRELERTVDRMVRNGTKFVGLREDEHDELRRKAYELTLSLLVRAQLDYSTAMVLLDSEDAPFGLERLERIEQLFRKDLLALQAMFETAVSGTRPMPLSKARRRARRTEGHVRGVIEYLVARIEELEHQEDETLVLSLDPGGSIVVEALPPASGDDDSFLERDEHTD